MDAFLIGKSFGSKCAVLAKGGEIVTTLVEPDGHKIGPFCEHHFVRFTMSKDFVKISATLRLLTFPKLDIDR